MANNHCEGCPLEYCRKLGGRGNPDSRILIVTGIPTDEQARDRSFLPSDARKLFIGAMAKEKLDYRDFYYHPGIRCAHNPDEYRTADRKIIANNCKNYIEDEITEYPPDLIITLGAAALNAVTKSATKLGTVRGELIEHGGIPLFPMLNPVDIVNRPDDINIFRADMAYLASIIKNDNSAPNATFVQGADYTLIDSLEPLIGRKEKDLVYDVETLGLRPYADGARLLSMQFCFKPGEAYMLLWDHPERPRSKKELARLTGQLEKLLCREDRYVIGHNLKYDLNWTQVHTGIRFRIADDTQMMAARINENDPKDLDDLTKIYVKEMAGYADEFNRDPIHKNKSRMDLVPIEKLINYGCGDVDATMRLFNALSPIIERDKKLYQHYREVSIPGLNMFSQVDQYGVDIDDDNLDSFEKYLDEYVTSQRYEILSKIPKSIKRLHADPKTGAINLGSPKLLLDWLFYHKDGLKLSPVVYTKTTKRIKDAAQRVPSTSGKDHLPFFFDEAPIVKVLAEHMSYKRLLETSIRKFRDKYIVDGKVHPVYAMHVTDTGRTSSADPNGQNFPKRSKLAKRYRRAFVAPPGYAILEVDLSQAELRIAGGIARDPVITAIYREDGDIHILTAQMLLDMRARINRKKLSWDNLSAAEKSDYRRSAKAINFGFIYGMMPPKFVRMAKTDYDADFTEEEGELARDGYFNLYPGLLPWHKSVREFVLANGYIRSPTGCIRHLPNVYSKNKWIVEEAIRQGINAPVQETGSSIGVIAASRISQEIDPKYLRPIAFVHDAIYSLVPLEYAEWGAKTVKSYMETVDLGELFGFRFDIPIVAEAGIGFNLGDVYEMKGLKLDEPFDWEALVDSEGNPAFDLPPQRIPPQKGRIVLPSYLHML